VFFGGGTPTLLAPRSIERVIEAIDQTFGIAPGAEVTIEANPETVDTASFRALRSAGINRVSIGVQSLAPHVLAKLGRTHDASTALTAVDAARSADIDDVNMDVIYGSIWESDDDWDTTLSGVVERAPQHVSAYALTIEEGTPLHTLVATGRVPDVDPDVQAARHARAEEVLGAAGFVRYEVSNWARPGRASAHNVLYWSAGNYAGFGAGAHAHVDGERWWNVRLPRDFIAAVDAGRTTVDGSETLSPSDRAGEALMLGLRLADGLDPDAFARRFGDHEFDEKAPDIARLIEAGLLERTLDRLRLTARGTQVANEVAAALL
jgi:oxygen-independent coproporphyrinogen-3 oxidase